MRAFDANFVPNVIALLHERYLLLHNSRTKISLFPSLKVLARSRRYARSLHVTLLLLFGFLSNINSNNKVTCNNAKWNFGEFGTIVYFLWCEGGGGGSIPKSGEETDQE